MNKELIKKYKTEFDHWLNGGKILYASYDLDGKNYSAWYELHHDCKWDYNNAYRFKFIINDAFVEFRKALAEGKIIQYRNLNVNAFKNWQDLGNLKFNPNFEHRIKPEEPKFKVGDWVRVKTDTFEYDGTARISKGVKRLSKSDMWLFSENHYKCNPDNYIEHWQPKEGEWCWFWEGNYNRPTVGKLSCITESGKFLSVWGIYDYCEPFIGALPTNLKD